MLFRMCPNFVQVRLIKKEPEPIAFIDFKDVSSAHAAIVALQGFYIDDTSIHIEYDREQLQQAKITPKL